VSDIRGTLFYLLTYFIYKFEKIIEMKKLLLLLTIISFLIGCVPEKTMNRKLNGTWKLISISNKTLPDSLRETVDFSPEGRNGKIAFHIETKSKSTDSIGIYTIMKYESITTSFINDSELGYVETVYDFTKCTDNELILTQQKDSLDVYYFKKVN
jgi:hypothetical protein